MQSLSVTRASDKWTTLTSPITKASLSPPFAALPLGGQALFVFVGGINKSLPCSLVDTNVTGLKISALAPTQVLFACHHTFAQYPPSHMYQMHKESANRI